MSVNVGISLGDSFAEVFTTAHGKKQQARWYLPKKSGVDGIREFVQQTGASAGRLHVVTSFAESLLAKKLGSSCAILVTSGFEHWLQIRRGPANKWFSLSPQRLSLPINDDLVFGLTERVKADGSVETALNPEELQFLVSKLKLLNVTNVALGLMHAGTNPTHEQQAAAFLREQGFEVFCSHHFTEGTGESTRWWLAILNAYLHTPLQESRKTILEAVGTSWEVSFEQPADITGPLGVSSALGLTRSLQRLAVNANRPRPLLHLGLEKFLLVLPGETNSWMTDVGELSMKAPKAYSLAVQPTQGLIQEAWPMETWSGANRGFEPGPMLFGKSLHPTVLDVLYARNRLKDVEAFSPLVVERTRPRILEAFLALSKHIPTATSSDPALMIEDLESSLLEKIVFDIVARCEDSTVLVSGALATSLQPLLKRRCPGIEWKVLPESEWTESQSAAATIEAGTLGKDAPERGQA